MGLTGSGKSQALGQYSEIPQAGARVVLLDPSRDHATDKTYYYDDRTQFARALAEADASGLGFRIGYDGPRTPEIYEWWCRCCIAILDGQKTTYMLTEELARVSKHAGEALPAHGWIMSESRKYGGIYLWATQFPARISKDVYDNTEELWFGCTAPRLQKQFADQYGLDTEQLAGLKNLEFLRWKRGEIEKITVQYKKK